MEQVVIHRRGNKEEGNNQKQIFIHRREGEREDTMNRSEKKRNSPLLSEQITIQGDVGGEGGRERFPARINVNETDSHSQAERERVTDREKEKSYVEVGEMEDAKIILMK